VHNEWPRTSWSPSTGAPSVDEPRSRITNTKVELEREEWVINKSGTHLLSHSMCQALFYACLS
jgi:hypothetical protein